MCVLKGKKLYLSGPMEFDIKEDWRSSVIYTLENKFGLKVFNPAADEEQILLKDIEEAKKNKNFDVLEKKAKVFTKKDFGHLDRSDILLGFVPRGICTTGTPTEIKHSLDLKKPTLLVCPEGKENAALWYWGLMKHQYIFSSFEEIYTYLKEVCDGQHNDNHRWAFILGKV